MPENIWSVWLDYWRIGRLLLHIHFYFHIKRRPESNLAIIAFICSFSHSLYVCVAVAIRATDLGHLKRVVWILPLKFIFMSEETYRERQPPQFLLVIYCHILWVEKGESGAHCCKLHVKIASSQSHGKCKKRNQHNLKVWLKKMLSYRTVVAASHHSFKRFSFWNVRVRS